MRLRERGIVLIGILVLTLLATFFVGALLQMNPTRLRRTVQDERHDHAAAAARAGVEYCLGQLAEDQTWVGQANTTTVQTDTMVVREDRGNVTGWVRAENGDWAGFRLRFNHQDGPGGKDKSDDPAELILSPAISLNNLEGESGIAVPLGTGPNFSYVDQEGFVVPRQSVALLVEGMVGPGIAPDRPAGLASEPSQGQTVTRTLEGIYTVSGFSEGMPDGAVLQAGGDTRFILGTRPLGAKPDELSGYLRLAADDQTAIMRTKGSSRLQQGAGKTSPFNFFPDMHADVRVGRGGFNPVTKAGQEFNQTTEAASALLMDIEWDKVAESDQPNRYRFPAGVYTVGGGDTDGTNKSRINYFPMTFSEYRQALINGETPESRPVPKDFLDRVTLNGRDWTAPDGTVEKRDLITFDRDIEVETVNGNKDLAIIPVSGAKIKSVSNLTSTIPPAEFATSPRIRDAERAATGEAILKYLAQSTGQSELTFAINANQYTYDATTRTLSSGSPADIALAVLAGGQLSFQNGIIPQMPGIQPGGPDYFGGGGGTDTGTDTGTTGTGTGATGGTAPGPRYQAGGFTKGPDVMILDLPLEEGGGGVGTVGGGNPTTGSGPSTSGGGGGSPGWEIADPNAFMAAVQRETDEVPPSVLAENVDPHQVPDTASDDRTIPQDLEISFAPSEGQSAAIRTNGNVMLATHLSGEGGAVVAGGRIDIIGLGIDLNAGHGERDGVSLYSKKDITISTYDQRRNKYWDAKIKGVIFAKGNLSVRLGETVTNGDVEPPWGSFDYMGSAIVLGNAPAYVAPSRTPAGGYMVTESTLDITELGNAAMIAKGIRLFYEPKFLAPYVEAERMIPVFGAVSVVEK